MADSDLEGGKSVAPTLAEALTKIVSIAKALNERKRKAERMKELLEVQSRLSGAEDLKDGIVMPHRELLREGELHKKGGVFGDKPKRVFLFNDMLLWCVSPQPSALSPQRWLLGLHGCSPTSFCLGIVWLGLGLWTAVLLWCGACVLCVCDVCVCVCVCQSNAMQCNAMR